MIVLGLLLSLAAPLRAQVAPAPVPAVEPGQLDELFKRFTSGKPMLPTLKEVQAAQLKRDLAPRPDDKTAPALPRTAADIGRYSQPPKEGVRRDTTESVDVAVSRPLARVELGLGAAQENVVVGRRSVSDERRVYGFLSLDLSKVALPRKLFHSPTATHTETVVQDDRVQVSKDHYTADYLKHPH